MRIKLKRYLAESQLPNPIPLKQEAKNRKGQNKDRGNRIESPLEVHAGHVLDLRRHQGVSS